MAITLNTNIKNDTDGYLLDAKNVKGGYLSVDTLANLQSFSLNTKEAGSFAYVRENSKFYTYNGTSWQEVNFYDDTAIKNIIPVEANVNNKLADKNYVSERMAQVSSGTAIYSYDTMFALFAQYIYDKLVADGINVSDDTIMHLIKQSIGINISNSTTETIITLDEALTNANLDINHIMSLVNFDYIDNKIKDVKGSFMLSLSSSWDYINDGDIDITEMFTTHGITEIEPLSQTFKLKSANIGDNIYIASPSVPDLWLAVKASSGIMFVSLDSSVDLSNIESSMSSINTEINSVKSALDLKADKKDVSEVDINLEGTSTTVSIPENTTGYGSIVELGGKSYKSENLIVLNDVAETTTNGITYSSKDGVITLNGTSSDNTNIAIPIDSYTLSDFHYLNVFSSIPSGLYTGVAVSGYDGNHQVDSNGYAIFDSTFTIVYYRIYVAKGTFLSNVILKPMLVKGSIAPSEFKQGFEGIKTEYPTNVKVVGTNLLYTNKTKINVTSNSDILELNLESGTQYTCWLKFKVNNYSNTEDKIYSNVAGGVSSISADIVESEKITVSVGNTYLIKFTFTTPSTFNKFEWRLLRNTSYGGLQINADILEIGLFKGSTAPTTFKPYTEQNLPQTNIIDYVANNLQTNHSWTSQNANKWLGLGVSDSNIIDYDNKKAIVKYSIVDLGTLTWDYDTTYTQPRFVLTSLSSVIKKPSSGDIISNIMCSIYESVSLTTLLTSTKDMSIAISVGGYISISNHNYTNATDFKTAMSGIMLIYELATPIEIDISEIESEAHFGCESNGTIIHNSITNYKYSFPVSLKGQVELNFEHDKEQQRDIDTLYSQINSINKNIGDISAILDNINGEVI